MFCSTSVGNYYARKKSQLGYIHPKAEPFSFWNGVCLILFSLFTFVRLLDYLYRLKYPIPPVLTRLLVFNSWIRRTGSKCAEHDKLYSLTVAFDGVLSGDYLFLEFAPMLILWLYFNASIVMNLLEI